MTILSTGCLNKKSVWWCEQERLCFVFELWLRTFMLWIPNSLPSRLTLMNISGGMVCESRPAASEYEQMKANKDS